MFCAGRGSLNPFDLCQYAPLLATGLLLARLAAFNPLTPSESVFIQPMHGPGLDNGWQQVLTFRWVRKQEGALSSACAGAQSDAVGRAERCQEWREHRIVGKR